MTLNLLFTLAIDQKKTMPKFKYTALNRAGQYIDGEIEAIDMPSARIVLSDQGKFVSEIVAVEASADVDTIAEQVEHVAGPAIKKNFKLSNREKQAFISQFATALRAKIPVMAALEVVAQQNPSKRVVKLVTFLTRQIRSGNSLSVAMAGLPAIFDRLDISLVKVGESTGSLDECMSRLSEVNERELEVNNTIITSSLYPVFVLFIGLISSVIVITWIMPRIISTLAVDIRWLPWPTRIMMNVGEYLNSPAGWITVTAVCFAVLFIARWSRTIPGRLIFDRLKLALPIVGDMNRKWAVSRFARMLGVLTGNGVDMLTSLKVVRNCLNNEILARQIDNLVGQVRAGSPLAGPLKKSALFPALLIQVVSVGENTGLLPDMLINAADSFDKETDQAVKRFMAIFPAILIFVLAIFIGFLLMATLLPIIQVETSLPMF